MAFRIVGSGSVPSILSHDGKEQPMTIPKVLGSRLQRVIADAEFDQTYTFVELCNAVAQTSWAQSFGFSAHTVAELILHHQTETKCEKPEEIPAELQETPEPEPPVVVAPKPPVQVMPTVAAKPEAEAVPTGKTYDEAGKGRKQCSGCKKYVGLRTMQCPACGHAFESKKKEPPPEIESVEIRDSEPEHQSQKRVRRTGRRGIHAPAGACPHRLSGTDRETVFNWAEECRRTFLSQGDGWLTLFALKFFVKQFYDSISSVPNEPTPEYKEVCTHLDALYGGSEEAA